MRSIYMVDEIILTGEVGELAMDPSTLVRSSLSLITNKGNANVNFGFNLFYSRDLLQHRILKIVHDMGAYNRPAGVLRVCVCLLF